jgi:N-acetylmuramoyl-L-alanine amidase
MQGRRTTQKTGRNRQLLCAARKHRASVIIECGFLSNASDAKRLQDPVYQQKLANGIVEGIIVYLTSLLASGYE